MFLIGLLIINDILINLKHGKLLKELDSQLDFVCMMMPLIKWTGLLIQRNRGTNYSAFDASN